MSGRITEVVAWGLLWFALLRLRVNAGPCLSKIEQHLANDATPLEHALWSAKVFAGLISICAVLRTGLHKHAAASTALVADWCADGDVDAQIVQWMLQAATTLCVIHPEEMVALVEEHRRVILHRARQCLSTSGGGAVVALEWTSAHLTACETAG